MENYLSFFDSFYAKRMEVAAVNGKESSNSILANGMDEENLKYLHVSLWSLKKWENCGEW